MSRAKTAATSPNRRLRISSPPATAPAIVARSDGNDASRWADQEQDVWQLPVRPHFVHGMSDRLVDADRQQNPRAGQERRGHQQWLLAGPGR